MNTRDRILDLFESRKEYTVAEIAKELEVDRRIVKALLREFSDAKKVIKVRKIGLVYSYRINLECLIEK